MTEQPNKQAAGAWGTGGFKDSGSWKGTENDNKRLTRGIQVALLDKGRGSQIRVSLSAWRGLNRIEIREVTEICAGTGFPTKSGVLVPVELVDDLIGALGLAKDRASSLGLLARRTKE